MTKKWSILCLILSHTLLIGSSQASDLDEEDMAPPEKESSPFSGTLTVTSNYISEGISNSNNKPAAQASLTYTFLKTGVYFTLWGSTVDFTNEKEQEAYVELDAIAGINHSFNDAISYDLYIDQYIYPNASGSNYTDWIASFTYKMIKATVYYSWNVYGSGQSGAYYNAAIHYDIPEHPFYFNDMGINASIGHYTLPKSAGLYSYNDYMLGVEKAIKNFSIALQWMDTSHAHSAPWDGSHIVFTMEYEF